MLCLYNVFYRLTCCWRIPSFLIDLAQSLTTRVYNFQSQRFDVVSRATATALDAFRITSRLSAAAFLRFTLGGPWCRARQVRRSVKRLRFNPRENRDRPSPRLPADAPNRRGILVLVFCVGCSQSSQSANYIALNWTRESANRKTIRVATRSCFSKLCLFFFQIKGRVLYQAAQ